MRSIWLILFCFYAIAATARPLQIATSLSDSAELSQPITQLIEQAYKALGYQVTIVRLPAGRSLRMANQGSYDGELFRIGGLQQQFPELIQVPVPLRQLQLFAYVQRSKKRDWQSWQTSKELIIGHVRGFKLASQITFAGSRVETTTLTQARELLLQGKIDLLLEDEWSLAPDAELYRLPTVLAQAELFHYVHSRHQALVPLLSQQLNLLLHTKKNP